MYDSEFKRDKTTGNTDMGNFSEILNCPDVESVRPPDKNVLILVSDREKYSSDNNEEIIIEACKKYFGERVQFVLVSNQSEVEKSIRNGKMDLVVLIDRKVEEKLEVEEADNEEEGDVKVIKVASSWKSSLENNTLMALQAETATVPSISVSINKEADINNRLALESGGIGVAMSVEELNPQSFVTVIGVAIERAVTKKTLLENDKLDIIAGRILNIEGDRNLTRDQKLQKLLELVSLLKEIGYQNKGMVGLLDPERENNFMKIVASVHFSKKLIKICESNSISIGKCLCYEVLRTGKSVTTCCLEDPDYEHMSVMEAGYEKFEPHGHIQIPLLGECDEVMGLLGLYINVTEKGMENDYLATRGGRILNLLTNAFTRILVDANREERENAYVEALRVQQKMTEHAAQAKSLFLANMSHEIRTPMNIIMGIVEETQRILKDIYYGDLGKKEIVKRLGIVNDLQNEGFKAINHLLGLIDAVLQISKIEAGEEVVTNTDFSLRKSVGATLRLLKPSVEKEGIDLVFKKQKKDKDKAMFYADEGKLRQIIMNLVSNAKDHTKSGGKITVSLEVNKNSIQQRKNVVITVEDTGHGIAQDKLKDVFEPFVQVDNSTTRKHQGTGLGLTIVKQFAEMTGGNVMVESKEGKGTTFRVTLHFDLSSKETVMEDSDEQEEDVSDVEIPNGLPVLLVEDNNTIRLVQRIILKNRLKCNVFLAKNGKEALEILKKENVSMVFMDLHMPEMDGFEATKIIRSGEFPDIDKDLYIAALTADAMEGDREIGMRRGMNDYLTKPVTLDIVEKAIKLYLKKKQKRLSEDELEEVDFDKD